jgi:hypothetical protein
LNVPDLFDELRFDFDLGGFLKVFLELLLFEVLSGDYRVNDGHVIVM